MPVGGSRHYDGPGLAQWAPWKCPACAAENTGSIDAGCTSCGSGSVKARHVGVQPPPVGDLHLTPAVAAVKKDLEVGMAVYALGSEWLAAHPQADLLGAFIAGYQLATQHAQAKTMTAPPVTADLAGFSPDGKVRRTIIAALEFFKDRVLPEAADEIASGEWCAIAEVESVIQDLLQQENQHG